MDALEPHQPPAPPGWDIVAAELAVRLLGDLAPRISWRSLGTSATDRRRYEVRAAGGAVAIAATDVGAAAFGLHEYVKAALRRKISWDTPLPLPVERLPDVDVSGLVPDGAIYHQNFCTFSYTSAYWDWPRWEREIDWMALHGVTMPLATVGHEAVLDAVYRDLGLGDDEIRTFLGSPAYLAWQFMGCLDGWGAPMTAEWIEEHRLLGARILERQRRFGMTPVLPAFVGHVPASLGRHDTTTREWWGFTTHLLDPADPRFELITRLVVETQRELFGVWHLYAADPFIETVPPDDDPGYLGRLASTLVRGLRAGDPEAVWVMQAWTFDYLDWWTDDRIAAFLDAIGDDEMLLLDLWGEKAPQWRRFGGFRGKPWIWCTLHDFGGRCDLFGDLDRVRRELLAARRAPEPPIGIGLAMEATEQNHVVYEWVLDPAAPSRRLEAWVGDHATERYGTDDRRAAEAWHHLLETVYAAPADRLEPTERPGSVTSRPRLGLLGSELARTEVEAWCWFEPARLVDACRLLAAVARERPALVDAELGHDLVAATATTMVRACDRLLLDVVSAFRAAADGEPSDHDGGERFDAAAARLLTALADLDELLGTRWEMRLDTWEQAALSWSRDPTHDAALLDGARRLVSTWTASDAAPLTDYAARLWHGLVGGLYRERWRVWLDELARALGSRQPPDPAALDARIHEVTEGFLAARGRVSDTVPSSQLVDIVDIVDFVLDRYAPLLAVNTPEPQPPPSISNAASNPTRPHLDPPSADDRQGARP